MQACTLSIAQAHPSQVVKALVDSHSRCVALLLANSSCLIFPSLLSGTSHHRLLIPPPCSDICFLRLCERSLSSTSSEKSADTAGSAATRNNAKGRGAIGTPEDKVSDCGTAGHGSVARSQLYFLASMPVKAGSQTCLMAWRFKDSAFSRVPMRLDDLVDNQYASGGVLFDDIPHGTVVNIAASINVLVIYSPSVSKVWILSVKWSGANGKEQDSQKILRSREHTGSLGGDYGLDVASRTTNHEACEEKQGCNRDKKDYLQLIKCAIVDSNGPVYALHLSHQHLLLGQAGGLRLWALRPLIKGSRLTKKPNIAKGWHNFKIGVLERKQKRFENGEIWKPCQGKLRECDPHNPSKVEGTEYDEEPKCKEPISGPKNGFYEGETIANGMDATLFAVELKPSSAVVRGGKDCFVCHGNATNKDESDTSAKYPTECNGYKNISHVGEPRTVDSQRTSCDSCVQHEAQHLQKLQLQNGGLFNETHRLEESHSQHVLSQSSLFSSGSASSSSSSLSAATLFNDPKAVSVSKSSCYNIASLSPSVSGTSGIGHIQGVSKLLRQAEEGLLVSFQSQSSVVQVSGNKARAEQAVSIHKLTEREFLVLESAGKLYLLTLKHTSLGDTSRSQGASRVSINATLQHMVCAMKIKLIVVLPASLGSVGSSNSRVLWVSDGDHTIHVIALSASDDSKEGKKESHHLTVIQTVFTTDRICSMFAYSADTVMVLTEGGMFAYSSIGT